MRSLVLLFVLCCGGLAAQTIKQPTFFARRDYPGAGGTVAVADVNGDGIPDVITSGGPYLSILLGNGNGTFTPGLTTMPAGPELGLLVPVDLNGDGIIDLVINAGGNEIGVLFGNGDATFQPPIYYFGGHDTLCGGLVVADFTGNGIQDAVLSCNSGIWFFTGLGAGIFSAGALMPINPAGATASSTLVTADFNGDGEPDLAVAYGSPGSGASPGFLLLLGNGDGTFQSSVYYSAPVWPEWMAVGDLNHDALRDILLGGGSIFLNNGKGAFAGPIAISLPPGKGAIGDVNGDHIADIVTADGYVMLGLGDLKFAPPVWYPVASGANPTNAVLADLRGKGLTDIVAGQESATSVLLNEGKGTFVNGEWAASVPGAYDCAAGADFNRDGKPDLAVPTSQGITILFGAGNAKAPYAAGPSFAVSGPGCPIAGDLNGDGIPDLLMGANGLGGVGAYLGNGDGTFTLASVIPVGSGVLALGDFNHDGIPDLADSSNQLALGNGDGTFQPPVVIDASPPPGDFEWIAVGDVNNDGYSDGLATNWDPGHGLYVLLNNQHGGFTQSVVKKSGASQAVTLADLNGDGNLDAVVFLVSTEDAFVYLGNGKGEFTPITSLGWPGPDGIVQQIGDVNGDGIPDVLMPADGSLGIALGNGDGTFQAPFAVGVGQGAGQILQNLHGQSPKAGLPDIVSPDDSSGNVMVLINLTKRPMP